MDYRLFDSVRRQASPVEVELVEAYARGRLSRRAFVQRGMMIGIGSTMIGAVIAACGSDSGSSSGGTTPGGTAARAAPCSGARPAGAPSSRAALRIVPRLRRSLDPVAMADLGTYARSRHADYLVNASVAKSSRLAEIVKPNADGSVWTFVLRQGEVATVRRYPPT